MKYLNICRHRNINFNIKSIIIIVFSLIAVPNQNKVNSRKAKKASFIQYGRRKWVSQLFTHARAKLLFLSTHFKTPHALFPSVIICYCTTFSTSLSIPPIEATLIKYIVKKYILFSEFRILINKINFCNIKNILYFFIIFVEIIGYYLHIYWPTQTSLLLL